MILKTLGDRITYCRSALGLTRKDFSIEWEGASVPTLSRWELDLIVPSEKKIYSMLEFFCKKGLIVSYEWIKDGNGVSPALLNVKEFSEDDFDGTCHQTFSILTQNIKDFIYYKVTSNFFAPIIRYGDYVGGVKIEKDDICDINSLVFVVHDNTVHVGFFEKNNCIYLKNQQGKKMEFENYSLLAKLHWTATRP